MALLVYPTVRGIAWPVKRTQNWETQTHKGSSGFEVRYSFYTNPLQSWEISYGGGNSGAEGYLKDSPNDLMPGFSDTDFQIIQGFYNQQQGKFGTFLFDDVTPGFEPGTGPWDSVQGQAIATGDGSTTTFQLIRTIGGFTEAVEAPFTVPQPTVYLNGVAKVYATDFTVNSVGQIVFVVAPGNGVAITADFAYYWPVRFDEDNMEFENMLLYLWSAKAVKLVQVRL